MADTLARERAGRGSWRFRIRFGLTVVLVVQTFASCRAGAPDKDKSWDELIAQAKAHGGEETRLDRAASYVFQQPDGAFVTFTRMLDGSKRAVCAIDKSQNVCVCLDWDSGKTNWSERADVASPWRHHDKLPEEPGPLASLWSTFSIFLGMGRKRRSGYYRTTGPGEATWVMSH